MPRHFLTGAELSTDELTALLDRAAALKAAPLSSDALRRRSVALIFQAPSTRTRTSFETGIAELGGHPMVLRTEDTQLTRGESVKDADVTMERRDVLVLRDAYVNFPHADENLQLSENIPAGQPVLNHSVRQKPIIQRGAMVDGIFQDGALSISLKVELLEDGLLGQNVRVRNPKTKRELHGKVQNDQTVVIVL